MRRTVLIAMPIALLGFVSACGVIPGTGGVDTSTPEACIVGNWQVDTKQIESDMVEMYQDDLGEYSLTGTATISFAKDGTYQSEMDIEFASSSPEDADYPFDMTAHNEGTQSGTWAVTGSDLALTLVESDVDNTSTINGEEVDLPEGTDTGQFFSDESTITCDKSTLTLTSQLEGLDSQAPTAVAMTLKRQ